MILYERIRELRIAKNMSQDDLAHAMGYKDRSMITKIESGKVDISQKKIMAFANVLDTTPAYLMGWTDEVKKIPTPSLHLRMFSAPACPISNEARIISRGIDKMPPERRKQALKILEVAFSEYADYFKDESDNTSTR